MVNSTWVVAQEFIHQAMPTSTPPTATSRRGPKRSTRYASNGTSQVSKRMNVDNNPVMNGRPKLVFSLMGSTNSVQPYCRLAIITIVKMPTTNCVHRLRTMPAAGEPAVVAATAIRSSPCLA